MAEIISNKSGKRKSTPPRVDLTPMVDLGFLLITFFMFTTSLNTPNTMEINVPDKTPTDEPMAFIDTATITIIPTESHKIAYYFGQMDEEEFKVISISEMRKLITDKQAELKNLPSTFSEDAHKLNVIIKPHDGSKYEDLVTVLDEMAINDVPYYAITDMSGYENSVLTKILQ